MAPRLLRTAALMVLALCQLAPGASAPPRRATSTTTSRTISMSTTATRLRADADAPYGASDMISDELRALMEHDGDYYMHNQGAAGRELARCELLIVNADPAVTAFGVFEDMSRLTDESIPVSSLQDAVCMRFLVDVPSDPPAASSVAGSGAVNSARGRFIYRAPGANPLDAVLAWAADFASFEHLLLVDEADSFFWLDRIFLDLHAPTIGLAHTHPWLYWGAFVHDVTAGTKVLRPHTSGVIVSANVVEELAILSREGGTRSGGGAAAGGGDTEVLADLHARITAHIHDTRLQPMHDRRFAVPKARCQASSLSVTGLSVQDLKLMVAAVQDAGPNAGGHPCLALTSFSEEVVEELEIGGMATVAVLVGLVLWFRRRRRRLVRSVVQRESCGVASAGGGGQRQSQLVPQWPTAAAAAGRTRR